MTAEKDATKEIADMDLDDLVNAALLSDDE
jgi:hypothetical protein